MSNATHLQGPKSRHKLLSSESLIKIYSLLFKQMFVILNTFILTYYTTFIRAQWWQLYFKESPKLMALIRCATTETRLSFHRNVIELTTFRYIISLTARDASLTHLRTLATATVDKFLVNKLDGECGYPTCSVRHEDRGRLQQIKCHCTHLQSKDTRQIIFTFASPCIIIQFK